MMNRPKIEECTREITSYELDGSETKQKVTDLKKYSFNLERYCDQLENKYSKLLDDVHDYRHEVQSMKVTVRNLCTHFGVDNEEELMKIYMPDGKGK